MLLSRGEPKITAEMNVFLFLFPKLRLISGFTRQFHLGCHEDHPIVIAAIRKYLRCSVWEILAKRIRSQTEKWPREPFAQRDAEVRHSLGKPSRTFRRQHGTRFDQGGIAIAGASWFD